jgi:HK97 family phage portal protein
MTLISRAAASLSEVRGASPYAEWGNTAPPPPGSPGSGSLNVSTQSAAQIAAVYGCVALIADSVSSLPLRALDRPTPMVATAKELDPPTLMTEPFVEGELTDWLGQFVWGLALGGEFFGQIVERDKDLYASQIMPIPRDSVFVHRLSNGELEYRFYGIKVNTDDVFHVKYQSMPGMVRGMNPIQCMRFPFGLAHNMDVFAESYFHNSANPSGVLESETELTIAQTEELVRNWIKAHQGGNKANLPAVLSGGVKFNPTMINPQDSQFIESKAFTESQICGRVFRVPPHMVGIVDRSTSWGRLLRDRGPGAGLCHDYPTELSYSY